MSIVQILDEKTTLSVTTFLDHKEKGETREGETEDRIMIEFSIVSNLNIMENISYCESFTRNYLSNMSPILHMDLGILFEIIKEEPSFKILEDSIELTYNITFFTKIYEIQFSIPEIKLSDTKKENNTIDNMKNIITAQDAQITKLDQLVKDNNNKIEELEYLVEEDKNTIEELKQTISNDRKNVSMQIKQLINENKKLKNENKYEIIIIKASISSNCTDTRNGNNLSFAHLYYPDEKKMNLYIREFSHSNYMKHLGFDIDDIKNKIRGKHGAKTYDMNFDWCHHMGSNPERLTILFNSICYHNNCRIVSTNGYLYPMDIRSKLIIKISKTEQKYVYVFDNNKITDLKPTNCIDIRQYSGGNTPRHYTYVLFEYCVQN